MKIYLRFEKRERLRALDVIITFSTTGAASVGTSIPTCCTDTRCALDQQLLGVSRRLVDENTEIQSTCVPSGTSTGREVLRTPIIQYSSHSQPKTSGVPAQCDVVEDASSIKVLAVQSLGTNALP
jgi:hypothetical protein